MKNHTPSIVSIKHPSNPAGQLLSNKNRFNFAEKYRESDKRMNLAVCTSKSETFGHVIVEPMFAGIPVVTFDTGAASYLIRDFSNGFVIRNKAEKENFRKAVEFLLKNKEAAETMRGNNRKTANQLLTWDITADNTINMYLSIR